MRKKYSLLLICILCVALGFSLAYNLQYSKPESLVAAPKAITPLDFKNGFVSIAEKLSPSVVYITSERTVEVNQDSDPFGGFFGFPFGGNGNSQPKQQHETAGGSGVIVRSDGYVMTNDHVVGGADKVTIRLTDGREFKGKVLRDPRTDLALVKIDAKDLPTVDFADSDNVKVGQWAIAVGAPFSLRNTLTAGIVSAIRKETDPKEHQPLPYAEAIQTDASINPGNSGGPLVDIEGRVIGINGAIYSQSGGNIGIGFAIPSNTCKFVMSRLIDKGKVVRGQLGIIPRDITVELASKLGVSKGALVDSVDSNSAAGKAGIKTKDVIVRIDDKDISNAVDLRHTIEKIPPGTKVNVGIIRDKAAKNITVTLDESVDTGSASTTNESTNVGMQVAPLTSDAANQLQIPEGIKGVVVRSIDPSGPAANAGIERGDVITEIDNEAITSVATYSKAIGKLKSGDTAIVVVQRQERSSIIELTLD